MHPDLKPAHQTAAAQRKLLLVEFYGAWCSWCQRMDKTLADPKVKQARAGFHLAKMDVGRFERYKDLCARYGVKAVPHLIVLNSDGSVRAVQPGYCKPEDFLRFLQRAKQNKPTPPTASGPATKPPATPLDGRGTTPDQQLVTAAEKGDLATVQRLAAQGVSLDSKCARCGATSLGHAASNGHYEVAKFLLQRGANVNAGTHGPLQRAAKRGDMAMATLLLQKGADPNARCPSCRTTPLSSATAGKHDEMVKLLRRHGATQ